MSLTPGRARLALLALALGGFGIGATEFVAMGLLPNLAADLLPGLYSRSPEQANGQAGILISAYALGVVVGAPTIAALSARFPRRTLLLSLAAAFTFATVASALLPTFETVLAARFVAGLPHGAYFGIASLVAADIMGPGKRGQGVALVMSGLTISNVVGVPSITLLGQVAGWRVAYFAVAAIFAATFVAIRLLVPKQAGDPAATMGRELRAFRSLQVWLALGVGSVGFIGFFAVYTYVAPAVTDFARLDPSLVPIALITMGAGMTVGNLFGGWLADRNVVRSLFLGFGLFALALLGYALTAASPAGMFFFLFAIGATGAALSPAIQTRLMDVAGDSQSIAAAVNHSAFNIGNSLGAALGGVVVAAGLGYVAPAWLGLVACAAGVLLVAVSVLTSRAAAPASQVPAVPRTQPIPLPGL
ncbi:MFS transporter [Lysobacter korlensis]|uniref:MFS transporter n=1 Tax=Lysobacter korlensis TaxID=553636 RepID=A0ABV6RX98_9GAMM